MSGIKRDGSEFKVVDISEESGDLDKKDSLELGTQLVISEVVEVKGDEQYWIEISYIGSCGGPTTYPATIYHPAESTKIPIFARIVLAIGSSETRSV